MNAHPRIRLLFRDLSAAAAVASVAFSGSLPAWSVGLFLVGLLLALWDKRILRAYPSVSSGALALSAVFLFGLAFRGALDLIPAACTFALLLTTQRMLSHSEPTTDKQVHLSSVLTLAGGAALTGEWYFGVFLTVFLITATLSMGLGVLADFDYPKAASLAVPIRQLALGALLATVGAGALFVFIPRLSWNLAPRSPARGLGPATTGFTDRIRLGGGGSIKRNPRTVARVSLTPDPRSERLDAYFVGRTFDAFSGTEWSGTATSQPAARRVRTLAGATGTLQQVIEILPAYDSPALFGLEAPVRFEQAIHLGREGNIPVYLVHHPGEQVRLPAGPMPVRYVALSLPEAPSPLQPGGPQTEQYLQLPKNLDRRVFELAAQISNEETDALRAAEKLKKHLKENYTYSLEDQEPTATPLVDFLFVRKTGHCEHFATALTVLLRTLGFPSRVAAGFFGGERSRDRYIIRAGDAHAWTQVFVPGRGFVTVDATPETFRSGQPAQVLEFITNAFEWMESVWRRNVLDYSFEDQWAVAQTWVKWTSTGEDKKDTPKRRNPVVPYLLGAGALLFLGRRFFMKAPATRLHRSTRMLRRVEAHLARHHLQRAPNESPEKWAERLLQEGHPWASSYSRVVQRYLESRFGGRPLSTSEAREVETQFIASTRRAN